MAHFAELDENNKVLRVIVVGNADCGGGDFPESETTGIHFLKSLGFSGIWKQASYNSNFRKRFASIGSHYLPESDVFTHPSPYKSWVLVGDEWEAPIPKPDADGFWYWDEATQQWVR